MTADCRKAAGDDVATSSGKRAVSAPSAARLTHVPTASGAVIRPTSRMLAPVQIKNSSSYFCLEIPSLSVFSRGCPVLGQHFLSVLPSDPNSQPPDWILHVPLWWCLFTGQLLYWNISSSSQSGWAEKACSLLCKIRNMLTRDLQVDKKPKVKLSFLVPSQLIVTLIAAPKSF